MDLNYIIDVIEPYRRQWKCQKRNNATWVNLFAKDKTDDATHTLISVYTSDTDEPGTVEIAFKVAGIVSLFSKTSSSVNKWIKHAEGNLGRFATPKTGEQYPRIAISSRKQLANFLQEFHAFLEGGDRHEELSRVVPTASPVVDELILSQIWSRRGQKEFRENLLGIYNGKCAISGCDAEEALEAAHIIPHSENQNYSVKNGLLLRADIHTLFDLFFISIDPSTGEARVAKSVMRSYSQFERKPANLPSLDFIDPGLLKKHFLKWTARNG